MGTPIWLLSDALEPRGSSLYTLRLASRLPEHGFDPVVLCTSTAHIPPRLRQLLMLRELPELAGGLGRSLAVRRLVLEAGETPPSLVHAQRRVLDWLAVQLAERLDRPYVITVHD